MNVIKLPRRTLLQLAAGAAALPAASQIANLRPDRLMVGYSGDGPTDIYKWRDNMNRQSILIVSATIALGLALFGVAAGSTARAAEIKVLAAVALQPGMVALIPDFENRRGTKSHSPTEQQVLS